jgi:hypothetical protein
MSFGLSITNTAGQILVDNDFISYIEIASGSATLEGPVAENALPAINTITIADYEALTEDLIFVRMGSVWVGGGVFAKVVIGTTDIEIRSFGEGTIEYRIFRNVDISGEISSEGFGLEVLKANGDLSFSSNYRPTAISTTISGTYPFAVTFPWGEFYEFTKQPWVCASIGTGLTTSEPASSGGFGVTGTMRFTTVISKRAVGISPGRYGVLSDIVNSSVGFWTLEGTVIIPVLRGY